MVAKNFNSPSLVFLSSGQDELDGVMRDISPKSCDPCFRARGGDLGGPFKSQHVYDYLEKIDLIALETYMLTRLALLWAICLWSHSGGLKVRAAVSVYLHITCVCTYVEIYSALDGSSRPALWLCTFAPRMQ